MQNLMREGGKKIIFEKKNIEPIFGKDEIKKTLEKISRKAKKLLTYLKKLKRETKKTSKKNIAVKIFFISRDKQVFFKMY